MIALSSTEAEYVALSEAGQEATWLRNLYGKLRYPQKEPTIIKGDNNGSVVLMHNPNSINNPSTLLFAILGLRSSY